MDAINSWREEKQSAWLYRALAKAEPDSRIATLFASLADAAESQALTWADTAAKAGAPVPAAFLPERRARIVAGLARRLGPRRVRPALAALKIRGLSAYTAALSGHLLPTDLAQIGVGHKSVGGGNLRAAIFGVNDGLVSNASLILGVVGASASTGTVLATGIAGLLAGALSMAAGEYVSVRSQREMFEYQIGLEADELEKYPEAEAEELALIYIARGMDPDQARAFATQLVGNPKQALDVLAREELGLNPDDLGSPVGAAVFSFCAFTVGALVPLVPFFMGSALPHAAYFGTALAAAGLFGTGSAMSLFTGRNPWMGGLRMLSIGAAAGATVFAIGALIGVDVG
ncbi:MAG: VIT1/CCC1 transporter family protein [Arenimonas sp.]|uniref:VIT1/CCC1 transporter family protein n=1 Tax=Arenimonas sp. TaxID=1872635 RepID=UPI0025C4E770|nr:VIT1/CCC1 transporter family protein [Arenimonas sp.]MBW8369332.1 VIT1/CCC1 transporter family protein [Arenimonas sp.]